MSDQAAELVRTATWDREPARLDRALPEMGLARSRSQAAELIAAGRVAVDGLAAPKAGVRVTRGSTVEVTGADHYVSRAAHKLVAGLDAFAIPVEGKLALDLGASTGGFTQVLLEAGARQVLAIDVGHDQLVGWIRDDSRVCAVEGCNARDLTRDSLAASTGVAQSPELVVADLSFISLRMVLPAIARVAAADADLVLLIKPQFEVGRQGIREGIVTSPARAAEAIRQVLAAAAELGYATHGLIPSPIAGGSGSREYVVHLVRGANPDPTEWEKRVEQLTAADATDVR